MIDRDACISSLTFPERSFIMSTVLGYILTSILLSAVPLTIGMLLLVFGLYFADHAIKVLSYFVLAYGAIQHLITTHQFRDAYRKKGITL